MVFSSAVFINAVKLEKGFHQICCPESLRAPARCTAKVRVTPRLVATPLPRVSMSRLDGTRRLAGTQVNPREGMEVDKGTEVDLNKVRLPALMTWSARCAPCTSLESAG